MKRRKSCWSCFNPKTFDQSFVRWSLCHESCVMAWSLCENGVWGVAPSASTLWLCACHSQASVPLTQPGWSHNSAKKMIACECVCAKQKTRRVASSVDVAILSYPVTKLGRVTTFFLPFLLFFFFSSFLSLLLFLYFLPPFFLFYLGLIIWKEGGGCWGSLVPTIYPVTPNFYQVKLRLNCGLTSFSSSFWNPP